MSLHDDNKQGLVEWCKRGEPMIWMNAAAVTVSTLAVIGLLLLLAVRGFGHFWPASVVQAQYSLPGESSVPILAERVEAESVPIEQLLSAGFKINADEAFVKRELVKVGNRDVGGADFQWVITRHLENPEYPVDAVVVERREWGNFYGFLREVKEQGQVVASGSDDAGSVWAAFEERIARASEIHEKITKIEKKEIGSINYQFEKLRLKERGLALDPELDLSRRQAIETDIALSRAELDIQYKALQGQLADLYTQWNRDSFTIETSSGEIREQRMATVVKAYRPNAMHLGQKIVFYVQKFGEFLTEEPREANTEGGIFPAIFGTVIMVLIMSVLVTPFGVVAAVYLREYAKQGLMTRIVRIAVNNLAGVPSIVYGVFGLGFFIYFLGAEMDKALFAEALPAPTFGTPGLLWASVTLALLTLPVVIVATEEGLARIPRNLREGSLALGATKAETLWRVVLPMASPAMMTGLILAVARAAGEVAPLMLVGVVKLAPSLPVDGNFPYFHLDQKFMHLGFHIYDVGFQSPNVEAARPLVYATALLLVVIIALLNLSAVALRNHLREKYKSLEM
ncbi:phosphate ABC transporter permease [gamma proteobacterium BDW918]|mgnify:FL=1|jgi:phosphate transport system permease protein|uniref:Phosphate transport system permease protein PstA n=1 Tax=Zhongshania aliphaticivorans TaxID=1470434 RepID=A0A127M5U8_9GAMM|nr:phosphate ABC transporter permease PstA [Zhongshania aliphaticivorans]AMO68598.1 phosphate ABC transporter permease [Zhongshania aliphaticivorans]EIF43165.1 phosphate ABC transporter permease [gamma proteobacterium BDW918]|tara:strand:+ start:18373 stop:20079 length:1707 start_codon:yes stop_codon:yes gene_type:complete